MIELKNITSNSSVTTAVPFASTTEQETMTPKQANAALASHAQQMQKTLQALLQTQTKNETSASSTEAPRVQVNSRPLSEAERAALIEARKAQMESDKTEAAVSEGKKAVTKLKELVSTTNETKASSHPYWPINYHNITTYSLDGTVTLEDGSYWNVSSPYSMMFWSENDPVTIRPNSWYPLLSNYEYELVNKNTGSTVYANIGAIGPEYYGYNSHWITDIDYLFGYVYLENGSRWRVPSYSLNNWVVGDHVIIGNYDGYFHDSIIINYNMNYYLTGYEG